MSSLPRAFFLIFLSCVLLSHLPALSGSILSTSEGLRHKLLQVTTTTTTTTTAALSSHSWRSESMTHRHHHRRLSQNDCSQFPDWNNASGQIVLPEGCFVVAGAVSDSLTQNLTISPAPGVEAAQVVVDMNMLLYRVGLASDVTVSISGITLEGVLLFTASAEYSIDAFLPVFFNLPDALLGARVALSNCTVVLVSTNCTKTFEQLLAVVAAENAQQVNETLLFIDSFQSTKVLISGVTLNCQADYNTYPPPAPPLDTQPYGTGFLVPDSSILSSTVRHSSGLLLSMQALQALQLPAVINIEGNIMSPDTPWPGQNLTLYKPTYLLASPEGVTYWNLERVPIIAQLMPTALLYFSNMVVTNGCMDLFFSPNPSFPGLLFKRMSNMAGFRFERNNTNPMKLLTIENTTFVTNSLEIKFFSYWSIVRSSPFIDVPILGAFLTKFKLRGTYLQGKISAQHISFGSFTGPFLSMVNVTLQTMLPVNAPTEISRNESASVLCGSGDDPSTNSSQAYVSLFFVDNSSAFKTTLQTVLNSPTGDPASLVPSPYPPIIYVEADVELPSSMSYENVTEFGANLLITGPVGGPQMDSDGGSPTGIILDAANLRDVLNVPNSSHRIFIYRISIKNPISLDVFQASGQEPPATASNDTMSALPLWAFKLHPFRNASSQLHLDSVTLVLSADEFSKLYSVVRKWSELGPEGDWKEGGYGLVQGTESMDVNMTSTNNAQINFNSYNGWGVNATKLRILSDSSIIYPPTAEAAADPPVASPLSPPPPPELSDSPPTANPPAASAMAPPLPPDYPPASDSYPPPSDSNSLALSPFLTYPPVPPPSSLPPPPRPAGDDGGSSNSVAIGIGVGVAIGGLIAIIVVAYVLKRRAKGRRRSDHYSEMSVPMSMYGAPSSPKKGLIIDGNHTSSSAVWTLE